MTASAFVAPLLSLKDDLTAKLIIECIYILDFTLELDLWTDWIILPYIPIWYNLSGKLNMGFVWLEK